MKRTALFAIWLAFLLALPAAVGLCESSATPEPEYSFPLPAVVLNPKPEERLNLRTEPDTGSATQGKFYTGVEVDVMSLEDGWAKVSIGGGVMEGYMLDDYLKLDARAKDVTSAIPQITVTHAGGKKLYDKRISGAKLLGSLKTGAKVRVLAVTADDWLLIETVDGGCAFMKNGGISPAVTFAVPGTASADYESGNYAGVMKTTPLYKDSGKTKSIRELTRGELVTVLRFGAQMSLVSIGRDKGYVSSFDINLGCGEWSVPIDEYTAVVSCSPQERLHLRTQPGTDAKSLGKYYSGTKVVINGDIAKEWVPVSIGNLTGYMKSEFLAVSGTSADSVVSAMPILCVTTPAGKLNLRTTASTAAPSLGAYADGTLVTLCGLTDEWAHVIIDGQLGFMLRKYLSDPAY